MRRRSYSFDHKDPITKIDLTGHQESGKRRISGFLKGKKNKKGIKAVIISLAVILLVGIGYEAYSFWGAANSILGTNVTLSDLKGLVSASQSALKQTDGRTNILVLGKGGDNHPGGQLTDTIEVVTINHADSRIAMISLPRDLQITTPAGTINKLNYAYTYGYEKETNKDKKAEAGAKSASDEVSKILGVPIHYSITLDFVGFKELVDSLGGVTVNVDKDLYDPFYPKDSFSSDGTYSKSDAYITVSIKAGTQKMDGITALRYARSRETTSDFDRAKRQQNLVFAIEEKSLSLGVLTNPQKVTDILNTLGKHIKTTFNLAETKELLTIFSKIDKDKLVTKVIDNNAQDGLLYSTDVGGYYLLPKAGNYSQIQAVVKNIFATDGTATDNSITSIEVLNGSGVAGRGGAVAELLKADGLEITSIDTYDKVIDTTVIENGGTDSLIATKIKKIINVGSIKTYSGKGVIRVIIGKDYGK
jgi:LCP family protein required for cell wall assembly